MKNTLINWYINSGGGSSYDSGYQAILDRAENQSFAHPSSSVKSAQNDLYVSLNDAGILAKLDILYIFANDQSGGFWKINWITPSSYQCTEDAGAVTKSLEGIKGNGTSTYANTNFNPSTNGVQTTSGSHSFGHQIYTIATVGSGYNFGYRDAAVSSQYLYSGGSSNFVYRNHGLSAGGTYTGGVSDDDYIHVAQPTTTLYVNGSPVYSPGGSFGALANISLRLGQAQGPSGGYGNALFSHFYMGADLSASEISDIYTAFNTYKTAIGI